MLSFLWLAILGAFLGLSSPAHAVDGDPMLNDAREQLEKAWNPGGNAPSNADRIDLLNSALDLLKKAQSGRYSRHRIDCMGFIKSALYELDKGDPDHKAGDYIHSAVGQIRDMT